MAIPELTPFLRLLIVLFCILGIIAFYLLEIWFERYRMKYHLKRGVDIHNNELIEMPGYYFYPDNTKDLMKLTLDYRVRLYLGLVKSPESPIELKLHFDRFYAIDLKNDLDRAFIPTHRRRNSKIYRDGEVPHRLTVLKRDHSVSRNCRYF